MPSPPDPPRALLEQGLTAHESGDLLRAERIYREVLQTHPDQPGALNLLGILLHQSGKQGEAEVCLRRAVELSPTVAGYSNALGACLLEQRKFEEARARLERALALNPKLAEVHYNLARLSANEGKFHEAEMAYRQSLELRPGQVEALVELADVLVTQGDFEEARRCFLEAIRNSPPREDLVLGLARTLVAEGRTQEAETVFRDGLRLFPGSALLASHLSGLLVGALRYSAALEVLREAEARHPESAEVHAELASVLEAFGDLAGAALHGRRARELAPCHPVPSSNYLFGLNYLPDLSPLEVHHEHCAWAEQCADPLQPKRAPKNSGRCSGEKLRIGYVSGDFRDHAVACFIEPILAAHDRKRFEIFLYSNSARSDLVTERLKGHADRFAIVAGMNDEQASETIRGDEVDILVDLSGHTGGNRLGVFARKPAPIQVTWIGYPNTTGMRAMDYRISDCWADPPGETDILHSEQLIRLETGFNCYRPPEEAPPVAPPPALAGAGFTFGSFNNLAKLNDRVLSVWAEILKETPGARLLLKCRQFADPGIRARTLERFAAFGVREDRLSLREPAPGWAGHLGSYREIDIALDPFPFNGATTTCEALWMGVPVLALAGKSHAGRVGVSLLSRLGLEDWIARAPEDYIRRAVRFAADLPMLADFRAGLRARMGASNLLNGPEVTAALEAEFRRLAADCHS
ncbi:MAG: tetratricopeptide repeat protein [Candidatus Omnitrophica bacterium]|nr:Beta-barrel assembly-enhancing protease [bacterium]NUN95368.1 tetratricopeptide repeat protein [Candidatus Omnitrophota bacterium]